MDARSLPIFVTAGAQITGGIVDGWFVGESGGWDETGEIIPCACSTNIGSKWLVSEGIILTTNSSTFFVGVVWEFRHGIEPGA